MHLPELKPKKGIVETQDVFLGLNHNLRIRPGEFYNMENLSSDDFPVLSPRGKRSVYLEKGNLQGLISMDGLCYVDGDSLYVNGKKQDLILSTAPEDCPKQLISMGAYLLILPDGLYLNLRDPQDRGSMENIITTAGPVLMTQCSLDGREILPAYEGSLTPEAPQDGSYWLNYEAGELKQYSASTAMWVLVASPFVKLSAPGIGRGFAPYDGIELSGPEGLGNLAGPCVLYDVKEDYVILPGLIPEKTTLTAPVTLSRRLPIMDFCMESGNRLWGCRYGPNRQGQVVNEIYCSKLGDFKNFSCFMGISTDSYAVSLGSEGPFTGAVSYGGHPLFFKENGVHKVFGSMPSDFSVQYSPCRGVEQGSEGSLAIVSEILYYKSPTGVCAYDGSYPREISEALGKEAYHHAAAGTVNGKYYISMEKGEESHLFVFDTAKGLWHREDDLKARSFCTCRGELFCIDDKGRLLGLLGKGGTPEKGPIRWMAESGLIGVTLPGNKYLSRLSLRLLLEPGSRVTVSVRYDSRGAYQILGTVMGMELRSFTLPIVPRRCDHLQLKLQGEGKAMIFSSARVLKGGSDEMGR